MKNGSVPARRQPSPVEEPPAPISPRLWRIIEVLQDDLEASPRPFLAAAQRLDMSEEQLLAAIRRLMEQRIIRRFGATLKHYAVGYQANAMAVWSVPPERLEEVGALLAASPAVTHCYARRTYPGWPYNLYAMIHGRTEEDCLAVARDLAEKTGVHQYDLLFTRAELKKIRMHYHRPGCSHGPAGAGQDAEGGDPGP